MRSLLVLDVVGLTPSLLGKHTPNLLRLSREGFQATLDSVFPAVTCPAQSTLLTGSLPREHGVVANGWYDRDLAEVFMWRQSNRLVGGTKVWERARERAPSFRTAKLFWWYNMYSSVDWSVTPRPVYLADGRKKPSFYTDPPELKATLERDLGNFPLFSFWGPGSDIRSSEWIGQAGRRVLEQHRPNLTLVYLPHLDYDLQRHGPGWEGLGEQLSAVDRVAGELIDTARGLDMEVIALSEYGISDVSSSVSVNRILRREGLLRVQPAMTWELLDPGASRAFAVSDHQVAHVYVRERDDISLVKRLLESIDGVDQVLDDDGKASYGLDHARSGELVAIAAKDRWFDYYYWLDEARAPDFARTVDIHRKPGYDPVELFLDPDKVFLKARIFAKLLMKAAGFRSLLDVIPLRPSLVRGSHGRLPETPSEGPLLISSSRTQATSSLHMSDVAELLLDTMFG